MPPIRPPCLVLCACSIAAAALEAPPARAQMRVPQHDYSLGPSVSLVPGNNTGLGPMVGIDATYLPKHPFWVSAGARALFADETAFYPYVEGGAWIYLTLGVGYSVGVGRDVSRHNGHVFVGLPLPFARADFGTFYAEPYYRPMIEFDEGHEALHEVGFLLKLTSWTGE